MQMALQETERRRAKQKKYNDDHGIEPVTIVKAIHDLTERLGAAQVAEARGEYSTREGRPAGIPRKEIQRMISEMEKEMKQAAKDLEFERAAVLRDQIYGLRNLMAEDENLSPWQRAKLLAGEEE